MLIIFFQLVRIYKLKPVLSRIIAIKPVEYLHFLSEYFHTVIIHNKYVNKFVFCVIVFLLDTLYDSMVPYKKTEEKVIETHKSVERMIDLDSCELISIHSILMFIHASAIVEICSNTSRSRYLFRS